MRHMSVIVFVNQGVRTHFQVETIGVPDRSVAVHFTPDSQPCQYPEPHDKYPQVY
jgi:hypothetical protein